MYTDQMKRAFRSISYMAPKNFNLTIIDNNDFLTLKASEKEFMSLTVEERYKAVDYMLRAKRALEDNGAIVLLVREGGKDV